MSKELMDFYNMQTASELWVECDENRGKRVYPSFEYNDEAPLLAQHNKFKKLSENYKENMRLKMKRNDQTKFRFNHTKDNMWEFTEIIDTLFATDARPIGEEIVDLKYQKNLDLHIAGNTLRHEAQFGGEGSGDQYYFVVSLTDNNGKKTYWKYFGWYASYNGGEITEVVQVEPKEVIKIEWNNV